MQDMWVWSPAWEDSLEKEMASHSSFLAWKIQWTEESGRLQTVGLQSQMWLSDQTTLRQYKIRNCVSSYILVTIQKALSSSKPNNVPCYPNNSKVHLSHYNCSLIHSSIYWFPSILLRLPLMILYRLSNLIFLFLLSNLILSATGLNFHSHPSWVEWNYVHEACFCSPKNLLL